MKIVYLVAHIEDISGGTRVIVEHVNRLARLGHEVELWTSAENQKPYFHCNVPVEYLNNEKLSEPDILVVTDSSLLPVVSNYRTQKKTFLLLQHDNEWVSEVMGSSAHAGLLREGKQLFDSGLFSLITVSSWLQQTIKSKYGIDSVCIPNGIDTESFRPVKPLIQSTHPSVLLLYDPQVWKGFNEAARAILELRKSIPELRVLILGKYFPKTPEIKDVYHGFPFPAIYFNRPEQSDISAIYSSASVFVSASWKEGFGLPGLEAMACGTPLVTTDSGGVREYAHPNETAVVVELNSVHAIAKGVERVLKDEGLRKSMIAQGLKRSEEFEWVSSILKLEETFKSSIL